MFGKLHNLYMKVREGLRVQYGLVDRLDNVLYSQGCTLAEVMRSKQGSFLKDFEFKVFSQWGEDGIIQKILQHVDIGSRVFIEFGVEDFRESNCRFLMMHDNWRGLVIDASQQHIDKIRSSYFYWRHHLDIICAFIDRDNINDLILKSGVGDDVGILSIDMDGVDYWILDAINVCNPRIIIVEYNAVLGKERSISVPYDAQFVRIKKHYSGLYYGASLAAFTYLMGRRGYSLLGTNSAGSNAFFVRNDLLRGCPFPALTVEEAFTDSKARESRGPDGQLTFLHGRDRLLTIQGLPVINVVTGEAEVL